MLSGVALLQSGHSLLEKAADGQQTAKGRCSPCNRKILSVLVDVPVPVAQVNEAFGRIGSDMCPASRTSA
jgi:hypothetical protein